MARAPRKENDAELKPKYAFMDSAKRPKSLVYPANYISSRGAKPCDVCRLPQHYKRNSRIYKLFVCPCDVDIEIRDSTTSRQESGNVEEKLAKKKYCDPSVKYFESQGPSSNTERKPKGNCAVSNHNNSSAQGDGQKGSSCLKHRQFFINDIHFSVNEITEKTNFAGCDTACRDSEFKVVNCGNETNCTPCSNLRASKESFAEKILTFETSNNMIDLDSLMIKKRLRRLKNNANRKGKSTKDDNRIDRCRSRYNKLSTTGGRLISTSSNNSNEAELPKDRSIDKLKSSGQSCDLFRGQEEFKGHVIRVQGDGRCLFRSLVVGMSIGLQACARDEFGRPVRHLEAEEETLFADLLRDHVVQLMRANMHFYSGLEKGIINADQPVCSPQYPSFQDRLDAMSKASTMPGDLELNAVAMVLERRVLVLNADLRPITVYGQDRFPQAPMLAVRFTRLVADVGHYDAVILAEDVVVGDLLQQSVLAEDVSEETCRGLRALRLEDGSTQAAQDRQQNPKDDSFLTHAAIGDSNKRYSSDLNVQKCPSTLSKRRVSIDPPCEKTGHTNSPSLSMVSARVSSTTPSSRTSRGIEAKRSSHRATPGVGTNPQRSVSAKKMRSSSMMAYRNSKDNLERLVLAGDLHRRNVPSPRVQVSRKPSMNFAELRRASVNQIQKRDVKEQRNGDRDVPNKLARSKSQVSARSVRTASSASGIATVKRSTVRTHPNHEKVLAEAARWSRRSTPSRHVVKRSHPSDQRSYATDQRSQASDQKSHRNDLSDSADRSSAVNSSRTPSFSTLSRRPSQRACVNINTSHLQTKRSASKSKGVTEKQSRSRLGERSRRGNEGGTLSGRKSSSRRSSRKRKHGDANNNSPSRKRHRQCCDCVVAVPSSSECHQSCCRVISPTDLIDDSISSALQGRPSPYRQIATSRRRCTRRDLKRKSVNRRRSHLHHCTHGPARVKPSHRCTHRRSATFPSTHSRAFPWDLRSRFPIKIPECTCCCMLCGGEVSSSYDAWMACYICRRVAHRVCVFGKGHHECDDTFFICNWCISS